MTADDILIGRSLRETRRRQGMTLRAVADRAGVTESFLSQVERDIASPSIATLRRIATALGTTIGTLLDSAGPHAALVRAADRKIVGYPGLGARDTFASVTIRGNCGEAIRDTCPAVHLQKSGSGAIF